MTIKPLDIHARKSIPKVVMTSNFPVFCSLPFVIALSPTPLAQNTSAYFVFVLGCKDGHSNGCLLSNYPKYIWSHFVYSSLLDCWYSWCTRGFPDCVDLLLLCTSKIHCKALTSVDCHMSRHKNFVISAIYWLHQLPIIQYIEAVCTLNSSTTKCQNHDQNHTRNRTNYTSIYTECYTMHKPA